MDERQAIQNGGPLALRLSVTGRCQMRCFYCRSPGRSSRSSIAGEVEIGAAEAVRFVRAVRAGFGLRSVRITGGEPLLREDICSLVEALASEGVPDLALTTNGQLLADAAAALKRAGLRRVNVSLDSLDDAVFRRVTGGGDLRRTIEGIGAAVSCSLLPVKLNCVVMRGINDAEVGNLVRFGIERGCHVRFIELMPIGPARELHDRLFVPSFETMRRLASDFDLRPLGRGAGSASRDFLARDRRGRTGVTGFISSETEPFCAGCRRIRLTSSGGLIGCLASGEPLDIWPLLKTAGGSPDAAILAAVSAALMAKPKGSGYRTSLPMLRIGG
ncbi:MAG: radical SAM protein [Planctomycetota bacterium]|nr:radical SAM protein [Planctomycetota bacterium]